MLVVGDLKQNYWFSLGEMGLGKTWNEVLHRNWQKDSCLGSSVAAKDPKLETGGAPCAKVAWSMSPEARLVRISDKRMIINSSQKARKDLGSPDPRVKGELFLFNHASKLDPIRRETS